MTDTTTTPQGSVDNTPLSFDQGVNAIAGLLDDDPVTEPVRTEVATSEPEAIVETGEEPALEISDDDLVLDDADLGELAPAEPEAPAAISDETEVSLDDGTKISIGQLKRNNLFQRDYSQKTEALAQQRKQLEQEHQQRVSEAERDLAQRREQILEFERELMPAEPSMDLFSTDPLAYIEQKGRHEEAMKRLNTLREEKQREDHALQLRQQEELNQIIADQRQKLTAALPHLGDATKRQAFATDAIKIGGDVYGLQANEIDGLIDHRYVRILHDALQYQKLKQKAAGIQKQVAAKPKLVQQQRMPQQAIQNRDRQGRFEALRSTGSIADAAKSIEDLID